jgi:hypothetical protein
MSSKPINRTVDNPGFRCQPVPVLATLSACLLLFTSLLVSTRDFLPGIAQVSSNSGSILATGIDGSCFVASPSQDQENSHRPLILANDSLVCVETEELDSFEEDSGHPQVFPEACLILVGEFSCLNSPRPPLPPYLTVHGLMSRRF